MAKTDTSAAAVADSAAAETRPSNARFDPQMPPNAVGTDGARPMMMMLFLMNAQSGSRRDTHDGRGRSGCRSLSLPLMAMSAALSAPSRRLRSLDCEAHHRLGAVFAAKGNGCGDSGGGAVRRICGGADMG